MQQYFGKYRAFVSNIDDPEKKGRIKVKCPKVLGDYESDWCLPCVPFAYDNGGFLFIPPVKELVWVEFEEGNPGKPIWVGCMWSKNKAPQNFSLTLSDSVTVKSENGDIIFEGNRLLFNNIVIYE